MTGNTRADQAKLDAAAVEAFGAGLLGQLVRPRDADYDTARRVYNGMIDKRPALIARCAARVQARGQPHSRSTRPMPFC